MVSNNKSDWPPPGWKVEIKVSNNGRNFKCYINSKTGQKFYSKLAVLRCIKNGSASNQGSCTTKGHAKTNQGNKQMHLLEATDFLDLPSGWTIEWRIRKSGPKKGTKYKCFIDPSTGNKFYSMPEVYRHLKSIKGKGNTGSSRQKERGSIQQSSCNSSNNPISPRKSTLRPNASQIFKPCMEKRFSSGKMKVLIERMSDEQLPSGWIKEMRIKVKGNEAIRRDPFYIDPVTGLVFRSKMEVIRYLETGEVSRHAYRRKNGSINCKELEPAKTSPTFSSKREQTRKSGTIKQLFVDGDSPKGTISTPPETGGLEEAGREKSKRSSSRARRAFDYETNLEQSTLLPAPVNMALEIVPTKPSVEKVSPIDETLSVTKQASPKVKKPRKKENDAKPKEMDPSSVRSRDKSDVELQGFCNGKYLIGKRRTKDVKVPSLPFRSSKRLAGVKAEVVFHPVPIEHTRLATSGRSGKTKANSRPKLIASESQGRSRILDVEPQNVFASREKARAFEVDSESVLATQAECLKKSDRLNQENVKEMVLQTELGPPGFSQNPKIEVLQVRINQSSVMPPGSKSERSPLGPQLPDVQPVVLPGSKSEKPPGNCSILEEPGVSLERNTEQPGSQFCFSSPLWSDPCLEFAFKTLTGAIPLDDNVAIQDYIQHQLRTSEQSNNNRSPGIGAPSFCQNDEMKLASSLPGDVSLTNSIGFGSRKSSR